VVRIRRCDHTTDYERVYRFLVEIYEPVLTSTLAARRITSAAPDGLSIR